MLTNERLAQMINARYSSSFSPDATRRFRLSAFQPIRESHGFAVLAVHEHWGAADRWYASEIVVWFANPDTGYLGMGRYFAPTIEGEREAVAAFDKLARRDDMGGNREQRCVVCK